MGTIPIHSPTDIAIIQPTIMVGRQCITDWRRPNTKEQNAWSAIATVKYAAPQVAICMSVAGCKKETISKGSVLTNYIYLEICKANLNCKEG